LEDGWVRVRTVWRKPLALALGQCDLPSKDEVLRVADQLLVLDAVECAVQLYLELNDEKGAARVIAGQADRLMDRGQWELLDGWLSRLSKDVLVAFPELIHDQAEIAIGRGDTGQSQRWFDLASSRFAASNDPEGACRSMLAASIAAEIGGDLATAKARAAAAAALAETADLPTYRVWVAWQRGRLAMMSGDTEYALASFAGSSAIPPLENDRALTELVVPSHGLARRVQELRHQQDLHREAQAALKRAEEDALAELSMEASAPAERAMRVVARDGWSQTPVPLKLPGFSRPGTRTGDRSRRLRPGLRRAVERGRPERSHVGGESAWGWGQLAEGPPDLASSLLAVHLLGTLVIIIDGVPADEWDSGRGRSLFAYLVMHRDRSPQREMLMDTFWPGSTPDAARNSLNVAIHGIRRALRTAADAPVIIRVGSAYRLNPDLNLWLDAEEFDRRVRKAQQLEEMGQIGAAMDEYEFAAGLYRGDLLASYPYEDWPTLPRERLRLSHLDVLDRLSRLNFRLGRYGLCAAHCKRVIELDPCREDAHRRLMVCYSRQGHPHLALLQYRACARVLRDELGVQPSPATVRLRDQIGRHVGV
jgi:DNA-binding SARP family transcriptional activator